MREEHIWCSWKADKTEIYVIDFLVGAQLAKIVVQCLLWLNSLRKPEILLEFLIYLTWHQVDEKANKHENLISNIWLITATQGNEV